MGSLQFCSVVKTAPLPNLSPNLAPPFTPHITDDSGHKHQACVTLAAGESFTTSSHKLLLKLLVIM